MCHARTAASASQLFAPNVRSTVVTLTAGEMSACAIGALFGQHALGVQGFTPSAVNPVTRATSVFRLMMRCKDIRKLGAVVAASTWVNDKCKVADWMTAVAGICDRSNFITVANETRFDTLCICTERAPELLNTSGVMVASCGVSVTVVVPPAAGTTVHVNVRLVASDPSEAATVNVKLPAVVTVPEM